MAIILDEPTTLETFLHYGLFLGAIFQIACIFAVIFIPYSENEEIHHMATGAVLRQQPPTKSEPPEEQHIDSKSSHVQSPGSQKKGRREKKKHR